MRKNKKRGLIILGYSILAFVAAVRFDVGADYDGYFYDVVNLKNVFSGTIDSEIGQLEMVAVGPIFTLLTFVFKNTPYTIHIIVVIYSVVEMVLLYKVLDKYNAHFWGVLLYIISCLMFNVWDLLKQGLSIMLVLYAYTLWEEKNLKKFLVTIFIAGLAHYTAWLVTPFYWLCNKRFDFNRALIIIIALLVIAQFGGFNSMASFLTQTIPYYSESYSESVTYTISGETTHDASYIFTAFWYIALLSFAPRDLNGFKILLFTGTCIYIMSGGNLLMDRIALYFSSSMLIYFRTIFNNLKKGSVPRVGIMVMLFMMFTLFNLRTLAGTYKGCCPYESIFSEECRQEAFRPNE